MRGSRNQLKHIRETLDNLQLAYNQVKLDKDTSAQANEVIMIEFEKVKKRISDLLDENAEMTEKQYENLSRKEVTLQLKLVSESLEKIKKSHEEINTNHKQLKIS